MAGRAPGDWQQLSFGSGTGSATRLENVRIEYGKGIVVSGAAPTFNDLSIKNHQGAAVTPDLAASPIGLGNQASGNDINAVVVPAGDIGNAVTWGLRGIPYLVQSGTISVGASPRITAISPKTVQQGETLTVTLSGSRLSGLMQPAFDGEGLTAQVLAGANDSQAQLQITASPTAALGVASLLAQVDAGEVTLAAGLTVVPTQPKLALVTPSTLYAGQGIAVVTLKGQNFTNQSEAPAYRHQKFEK